MHRALALTALLATLTACKGGGMQSMFNHMRPSSASAASDLSGPVYYHRKLEPEGRIILHGAGQTDDKTFRDYTMLLAQYRPMLYMSYIDLKDDIPSYFDHLHHDINLYSDYLVPQIGLSLNAGNAAGHYDADVASGALDTQLGALCTGLKSLDRPVYLRVGYEFNAPWNGYVPATYIAAFRRISTTLKSCGANGVALVWDYAPENSGVDPMRFYPGDDVVDWWAINLFAAKDIDSSKTSGFLDAAAQHRFPVMIGESTPQFHPVSEGQKGIDAWYQPYFALLHRYPQIKAFSYINWDWRQYPQWATWGDSRIQDDPTVQAFYLKELTDPLYQPAADRAKTLKLLHADDLFPVPAAKPAAKKHK